MCIPVFVQNRLTITYYFKIILQFFKKIAFLTLLDVVVSKIFFCVYSTNNIFTIFYKLKVSVV